jgi:hypothetical protein
VKNPHLKGTQGNSLPIYDVIFTRYTNLNRIFRELEFGVTRSENRCGLADQIVWYPRLKVAT